MESKIQELIEKNEKLSSEIDDLLDDKLVLVVKNTQQDIFIGKLIQENEKLKQAIEILKDKFNLKVQALHLLNSEIQYELQLREHCTTYCFSIPKDIYDLLKEVLWNE